MSWQAARDRAAHAQRSIRPGGTGFGTYRRALTITVTTTWQSRETRSASTLTDDYGHGCGHGRAARSSAIELPPSTTRYCPVM
jgi:hypothetical protein